MMIMWNDNLWLVMIFFPDWKDGDFEENVWSDVLKIEFILQSEREEDGDAIDDGVNVGGCIVVKKNCLWTW